MRGNCCNNRIKIRRMSSLCHRGHNKVSLLSINNNNNYSNCICFLISPILLFYRIPASWTSCLRYDGVCQWTRERPTSARVHGSATAGPAFAGTWVQSALLCTAVPPAATTWTISPTRLPTDTLQPSPPGPKAGSCHP